MDEVSVPKNEQ